jgi:hypothetical protein
VRCGLGVMVFLFGAWFVSGVLVCECPRGMGTKALLCEERRFRIVDRAWRIAM